jgi:hypothetical protein
MSWIEASLVSALFLGVYDLCIQHAIRDNAVLPVLFLSTLTGATVWTALLLAQSAYPGLLPAALVTGSTHAGTASATAAEVGHGHGLMDFHLLWPEAPAVVAGFTRPRDIAVVDAGGCAADFGRAEQLAENRCGPRHPCRHRAHGDG